MNRSFMKNINVHIITIIEIEQAIHIHWDNIKLLINKYNKKLLILFF